MCLGSLDAVEPAATEALLRCGGCGAEFLQAGALPVLLVDDDNWRKKRDEITGEHDYNVKQIPQAVHDQRIAFVDGNTQAFLAHEGMDLGGKRVLSVGCSYDELKFLRPRCGDVVCTDIVPSLTALYQQATVRDGLDATWVCADGECLPFENEAFDVVVVRQALHHMLKYFAAVSEFFRVCRVGGAVLLIDEPLGSLDVRHFAMAGLPGRHEVYGGVRLRELRWRRGLWDWRTRRSGPRGASLEEMESRHDYIPPDPSNPESYLADKYLSLSLLNLIHAVQMHTDDFRLHWPDEMAWVAFEAGGAVFHRGPHPSHGRPLWRRLVAPGNVSVAARKRVATRHLRQRAALGAVPLEEVESLLGLSGRDGP